MKFMKSLFCRQLVLEDHTKHFIELYLNDF